MKQELDHKLADRTTRAKGQGLVEYLVLTCLIAVAAISVIGVVGRNIRENYANISRAITKGEGKSVPFSEVHDKLLKPRGFNDYTENTGSESR